MAPTNTFKRKDPVEVELFMVRKFTCKNQVKSEVAQLATIKYTFFVKIY